MSHLQTLLATHILFVCLSVKKRKRVVSTIRIIFCSAALFYLWLFKPQSLYISFLIYREWYSGRLEQPMQMLLWWKSRYIALFKARFPKQTYFEPTLATELPGGEWKYATTSHLCNYSPFEALVAHLGRVLKRCNRLNSSKIFHICAEWYNSGVNWDANEFGLRKQFCFFSKTITVTWLALCSFILQNNAPIC